MLCPGPCRALAFWSSVIFSVAAFPSVASGLAVSDASAPISFLAVFLPSPFSVATAISLVSGPGSFGIFGGTVGMPPMLAASSVDGVFSPTYGSFAWEFSSPCPIF